MSNVTDTSTNKFETCNSNDSARNYEIGDINDVVSNNENGEPREYNYVTGDLGNSDVNCTTSDVSDIGSDITSGTSSTSYTSCGTYVSDGQLQCCYIGTLSTSSDETEETVNVLTEQLRGVTLDANELKTILDDGRLDQDQSIGYIYPNPSGLQLFKQYPQLMDSLYSIARERGGNVFVSGSLLRDLGQEDEHVPKHFVCDVCILSTTRPFVLITISSGESSSLTRYNATVARHIRQTVDQSANMNFDFVKGVFSLPSLKSESLEQCVGKLESATYKIAFPLSLLMSNKKYRHVLAAILPNDAIEMEEPSGCEAPFFEQHVHGERLEQKHLSTVKLLQKEENIRKLKKVNTNKTREIELLQRRVEELQYVNQVLERTLFRERNISRFLPYFESHGSSSEDNQSLEYSRARINEADRMKNLPIVKLANFIAASNSLMDRDPDLPDGEETIDIMMAKLLSLEKSILDLLDKTYSYDDLLSSVIEICSMFPKINNHSISLDILIKADIVSTSYHLVKTGMKLAYPIKTRVQISTRRLRFSSLISRKYFAINQLLEAKHLLTLQFYGELCISDEILSPIRSVSEHSTLKNCYNAMITDTPEQNSSKRKISIEKVGKPSNALSATTDEDTQAITPKRDDNNPPEDPASFVRKLYDDCDGKLLSSVVSVDALYIA